MKILIPALSCDCTKYGNLAESLFQNLFMSLECDLKIDVDYDEELGCFFLAIFCFIKARFIVSNTVRSYGGHTF